MNDLKKMEMHELENLRDAVIAEIQSRRDTKAPIAYHLKINGGNSRAGAKVWAKVIDGIDPSKGNGYGLLGEFLKMPYSKDDEKIVTGALPEGTLIVACGRGGSWKNETSAYVLLQVKEEATFNHQTGYQSFSGSGVELIASSKDEINAQEIVNTYPDLAPTAGGKLLSIYAKLKERF